MGPPVCFQFSAWIPPVEGMQGGREQRERGTTDHMQPSLTLLFDHQPEKARDDKCMG